MQKVFYKIFLTVAIGCFLCANSMLYSGNDVASKAKLQWIKIVGNKKISGHDFKQWLNLSPRALVTKEIVRQHGVAVLKKLQERGFYFARFDSIIFDYNRDSTNVGVTFHLNEGRLLEVNSLNISGGKLEHEPILEKFRTEAGHTFRQQELDEDVELLIQYYEEHGYPYCEVKITRLQIVESRAEDRPALDIHLQVEPGPLITIDEIDVVGNTQTKDRVILRQLNLESGEIYDQRKIDKIRPKLLKLGYFQWVNPPRLEWSANNRGKLIVELAEGSHNRFDGVIGYNPGTQSSKGFVTGLLDISFGNLFGTGREIVAHWQRRTENTQDLKFRYLEPWVAGYPVNTGLSFQQLIQDTSYIERSLGLDLQFLYNDNLSFFSRVSQRTISPDSLGALRFGIPPSNSINLAAGLVFNTLDDLLNPTTGVRYQTFFEWGHKKIKENSIPNAGDEAGAFNQKRISIDFETYFSLFRWQVLALAFHGRQVTSNEAVIPITEQYRLGGTQTLRGYREEQFRGSRIAWANLEYRYLLGRLSRFFVFLDVGYFYREDLVNQKKLTIEDAKIGYGIGLRVDTKLGFFGIDYGLGEGDGLSNGKVHIGLRNEF